MSVDTDNCLSGAVIGAAIAVHRELGPGAKEPAYERALSLQLRRLGIAHGCQFALPLRYKDAVLDCGYRVDVLVESRLPLELKVVETILSIHDAQLLTNMRIGGHALGLLINFEVVLLKDGVRRKVLTEERMIMPYALTDLPQRWDSLSTEVVASAIEVHRTLGVGLLRTAYEECLCHELAVRQIDFVRNHAVPLIFADVDLAEVAEVPLLVADKIPIYCLSVAEITSLHEARLRARLRQGSWPYGLILNFNAPTLAQGIRRITLS